MSSVRSSVARPRAIKAQPLMTLPSDTNLNWLWRLIDGGAAASGWSSRADGPVQFLTRDADGATWRRDIGLGHWEPVSRKHAPSPSA